MKALSYSRFGPPDVLQWRDGWPMPEPGARQVRIRVAAGGLNPKDVLLRKGRMRLLARTPLPRISGLDVAGTIDALGVGVTDLSVGQPVLAMSNVFTGGMHAEWAVVDADALAPLPPTADLVTAAAIPLAAQTALQALRDLGRVSDGSTVLVNGASGGVGHFAVQIAAALGARVTAVCSAANAEFAGDCGAHTTVDYRQTAAPEIAGPFDVVFDVFGQYTARDFAGALGGRGVYINTIPKPATLWGELRARVGAGRSRLVIVRSKRADLQWLVDAWTRGQLRPHIDRVMPMADAADAHRAIETRRTRGKIVLTV